MLEQVLAGLKYKLEHSSLAGMSQRNTDRVFVSPLLDVLGYDLANLEETSAGYHLKGTGDGHEIAYAFSNHGQLIMLLEIRPLYSDLSALKNLSRVFAIARAAGAPVLVFCNGVDWHIYAKHRESGDLLLASRIGIGDPDAAHRLRSLHKSRLSAGVQWGDLADSPDHAIDSAPLSSGPVKNRGYKISEENHQALKRLRTQIMTQRAVRDQDITNSMIVENLLKTFIDHLQMFDHREISNEAILRIRIEEALKKGFSK